MFSETSSAAHLFPSTTHPRAYCPSGLERRPAGSKTCFSSGPDNDGWIVGLDLLILYLLLRTEVLRTAGLRTP